MHDGGHDQVGRTFRGDRPRLVQHRHPEVQVLVVFAQQDFVRALLIDLEDGDALCRCATWLQGFSADPMS